MSDLVTTRTVNFWLDSDNILHVTVLANVDITLHDTQEIELKINQAIADTPQVVTLANISAIKSVSKEARIHATESMKDKFLAVALITASPISRMIGNFFLKINKPSMPTHLFTDEYQAMTWLKGFQK